MNYTIFIEGSEIYTDYNTSLDQFDGLIFVLDVEENLDLQKEEFHGVHFVSFRTLNILSAKLYHMSYGEVISSQNLPSDMVKMIEAYLDSNFVNKYATN